MIIRLAAYLGEPNLGDRFVTAREDRGKRTVAVRSRPARSRRRFSRRRPSIRNSTGISPPASLPKARMAASISASPAADVVRRSWASTTARLLRSAEPTSTRFKSDRAAISASRSRVSACFGLRSQPVHALKIAQDVNGPVMLRRGRLHDRNGGAARPRTSPRSLGGERALRVRVRSCRDQRWLRR